MDTHIHSGDIPGKIDLSTLQLTGSETVQQQKAIADAKVAATNTNTYVDKIEHGGSLTTAEMANFKKALQDLGNVQLPASQKDACQSLYNKLLSASLPVTNAFLSQTSILVLMAQIAVLRQKLGQETNVLLTKALLERLKEKVEIAKEQGAAIMASGKAQSETYTQQARTARAQGVQAITTAVLSGVMAGVSAVFAVKFGRMDPKAEGFDSKVQEMSQYSKIYENLEQCGIQISTAYAKFQEESSLNEQAKQTLFKTFADAAKNALDQCSGAMDSVIRKLEEGLSQIPKDTEASTQMQERITQSMTHPG